MRDMTPIFYEVVDKVCSFHLVINCIIPNVLSKLVGLINKKTSTGPAKMDILDLMMRTALEGVGQGGLGHSFKTLEEGDGNSPFRIALRSLMYV